jgi:hypothetical protein
MKKNQIDKSINVNAKEVLEQRREELLKKHEEFQKRALYEEQVRQLRQEFTIQTIKPLTKEIENVKAEMHIAAQEGQTEYEGLLEKYQSILNREKQMLLNNFYDDPNKYKNAKSDWWNLVSEFAIESLYDRWLSIRRDIRVNMQVPRLLAQRKELADILSASSLKPIPKRTQVLTRKK